MSDKEIALQKENDELKKHVMELQEHLSKYTNPKRIKEWQNKNKDSIKEYHKKYYQDKKKEKEKEN